MTWRGLYKTNKRYSNKKSDRNNRSVKSGVRHKIWDSSGTATANGNTNCFVDCKEVKENLYLRGGPPQTPLPASPVCSE